MLSISPHRVGFLYEGKSKKGIYGKGKYLKVKI
jgi:hypothetical protein